MSKNMFIYLTFLFIAVFAATPVAQSQTLSIAPSNQTTYDNWEPTNDSTLTFTVAVGGLSAASISAGEVRFDFETVSNWEGTCMNEGSGTDSDLNFTDTDQTTYTAPRWTQWSGASQNVVAAWNSYDRKNGGYHYHNPGTVPRPTTNTLSRTTTPNLNLPNSISEGSLPYTPTRLEWLALDLNAGIPISPIRYHTTTKANTIATYVFYDSTTTLKKRQELMNYAKKSIRNEANVRGWTWLKLEEHYQELK